MKRLTDAAIIFSGILEKVNVKPHKTDESLCYVVLK